MRTYYHFYPVCPNCHEPHINGSSLERIDNKNLRCSSCGVLFRSRIDIFSSGRFVNTVDAVLNKEGEKAEDYLSGLPLVWEVRPNRIEEEYIVWVNRTSRGKFLITWPWETVKFIPLLVSEYLLNNPARKVVVVGDISSDSPDEMGVTVPDIKEVFDSLIYLEGLERNDIDERIKKEMRKFDKKFVLQKRKVIHNVIHRIGTRYRVEEICDQNLTKCRNRLIREIKEDYGEESIRNIDERKTKRESIIKRVKTLNPEGLIDIKLEEREQWMGELKYKKEWLWNVLLNPEKIRRLNRVISATVLKEPEEERLDGSDKQLFFISSEMNPSTIFNLVKNIAPDLVVITNTDDFMKDVIYGGEKSRALFNFLKDCENSIILMFSTDPDVRHLYGINRTEKYTVEYNITPHTWDSEILIERIRAEYENHESIYSNLASSRWEELSEGGRIPEVEYIGVETLDDLDVFLDRVSHIRVDEHVKRDIRKYIYDLKRSPLFVRGDYEKQEVFRRRGNFLETITYDYMMSLIHERIGDEEEFRSMKELIDAIYNIESTDTINPLMKEIAGKAGDLLEENNNFITVVVHRYDVKGAEKLLHEMGFDEYMPQRLSVCSWGNLSQREQDIADNTEHYVISTLPPSLAYSIYSGHVKKFVFIGSKNNVRKIETIIKNRLNEIVSRPIYLLSKVDPAPELLKRVLKTVEIPSNEVLKNISNEIIVEFEEPDHFIGTPHLRGEGSHPCINSGEHAILVVDINGKGMFIPSGASLFIKEDHRPVEISLDNISSDRDLKIRLENKEMLVDRRGIYISFRSIFIKSMMVYGKKVKFRRGPYEWNGFQSLFNDAIGWISILEKALREYSYKNKITSEEAEKKVAEYLSSLNLTAKNPDYIRGWWSKYEIVTTEYGVYPLYEVEHPRSLNDLRKIYAGINDILPEMMLDPADAEKSYIASITIQNFRRSLLKGDIEDINPSLYQLYTRLEKEIKSIVETSPVFKVNLVYDVEITKEVEPFRVMDEYHEYVRISSSKANFKAGQ
ncbi:hypothetical protein DRO34_01040 [Candidatus Bathyarchaeota archaeon]|nr:MAG: hypothetical protein DRO34_01040 [Candidatus Bathyarchaeota archaeon]RLI54243.1 MAG: hypothetical protein DRP09_13610 [Candidatus Thorarchaeota archaeon]